MDHLPQGNSDAEPDRLPVNLRYFLRGTQLFFVIAIIGVLLEYDAVVNLSR